jgi:hypothetical protein
MLATSGVAVLLGVIPQGGAVQGIATIPEVIWEAFLGLYLLFKGFQRTAPIMAAAAGEAAGPTGLAATLPTGTILAPQAGAA